MKTFIQLKDGVGWASVNTTGEVEGSIEVTPGTGDDYIAKKYEDGSWSEADCIRFAVVNPNGDILEIKSTYYSSEVTGPILLLDTPVIARWVNDEWVLPEAPLAPMIEEEVQLPE